ncbi:MAG: IS1595 family transposase [Betaproteobacteria bacterium]|nr:IS1595 family transposase [Betaproteobacteria bacterium]
MADSILNAPHFQCPDKAREYLETQVWPNGRVCPHCGVIGEHYELHGRTTRPGLYKCQDCRQPFTVTVGSLFERSHIKLNVWLQAVYLICSSKKGISSKQLQRTLCVTYKTAWFMSHRIREAFIPKEWGGNFGFGGGTVEADETYIGRKPGMKIRRGTGHKNAIFSLVERGGRVRSFHVADVTGDTLKARLRQQVAKDAHMMTDEGGMYRNLDAEFASHETVTHSAGEYVRGNVHSNTVEGFFSIFKRGIYGVYQHVSAAHLQRYATEFDFRHNNREIHKSINGKMHRSGPTDTERTKIALKGITGKRLTYRRTRNNGEILG